jgi:hypothetical protein
MPVVSPKVFYVLGKGLSFHSRPDSVRKDSSAFQDRDEPIFLEFFSRHIMFLLFVL